MAGILRNALTIIRALFHYGGAVPLSVTTAWFRVTPLDTGIATLKSDKYLQMAEAAQVDYMLRTALMGKMLRNRWQFVNAAQLVRFVKPIRLFSSVRVDSQVVYADEKCAYFSHVFSVRGAAHAQVLVKMKFKKGAVTVAPVQVLGAFSGPKPQVIQRWDDTLALA